MAEKNIPHSMMEKFRKLTSRGKKSTAGRETSRMKLHLSGNDYKYGKSPSSTKPEENVLPSCSKDPSCGSTEFKSCSSSQSSDKDGTSRSGTTRTKSGLDPQKIKDTVRRFLRIDVESNAEIEKTGQERCNAKTMRIVQDFLEHADLSQRPRIPLNEKLNLFYLLRMEIVHGQIEPVLKYSEKLFYILIENYTEADERDVTKGLVMELFRDICANKNMMPFWHNSLELLLHTVFTAQRSKDHIVPDAARHAYAGLVTHFEVAPLLKCLISIIYNVTEMDLIRAIDMLKKLFEKRSHEMCDHQTIAIMYALRYVIKVNKGDSEMSQGLRQIAVDCMASLSYWIGQGRFQSVYHLIPQNEIDKFLRSLDYPAITCFSDISDGPA